MRGPWHLVFGEPFDAPLVREEPTDALTLAIQAAISDRQATFSMADAMALPPVARARDLITSLGGQFPLVEYADGTAAQSQSRFVRRPDPFRPPWEFTSEILLGLFERGEAFLRLGDKVNGYPGFAIVLDNDEVQVEWDARRFLPRYTWRGTDLVHGQGIYHLALNRGPGELHGRSALQEALPYLATVAAAEEYAAVAFGSGGVPATVLKTAARMTKAEADTLKAQWAESRRNSTLYGEPAIASGGVEPVFPGQDPQRMQMQEARAYGATVVARLLGIPAALLLVETSGATITYTNPEGAIDDFVKQTLVPRYLRPIEAAITDLIPASRTARFSMGELNRADVKTRFDVYASAIASGVMSAPECRAAEGLPAAPQDVVAVPAYSPVPAVETEPTTMSLEAVPVG